MSKSGWAVAAILDFKSRGRLGRAESATKGVGTRLNKKWRGREGEKVTTGIYKYSTQMYPVGITFIKKEAGYLFQIGLYCSSWHSLQLIWLTSTFDQTKKRLHVRAMRKIAFVLFYCLRFEKLIVSSKSAIEILEKFFECLNTQYSKLELNTRFPIASRIKDRVSSRDYQLTFAQYCNNLLWLVFHSLFTYLTFWSKQLLHQLLRLV